MAKLAGTRSESKSDQPVNLSDEEKITFIADLLVEIAIYELEQKQDNSL